MTFEDLDSWKEARKMVSLIYGLTKNEHINRDYGLCSQLQRASVSVMTNIAEGFERPTVPDKAQFYSIARASNGEVRSLLYVVTDNYPELAKPADKIHLQNVDTGRLLSGLIKSTKNRLK